MTVRTVRISKMFSVPASARIESAIAENESSAPVIQKTTQKFAGRSLGSFLV